MTFDHTYTDNSGKKTTIRINPVYYLDFLESPDSWEQNKQGTKPEIPLPQRALESTVRDYNSFLFWINPLNEEDMFEYNIFSYNPSFDHNPFNIEKIISNMTGALKKLEQEHTNYSSLSLQKLEQESRYDPVAKLILDARQIVNKHNYRDAT